MVAKRRIQLSPFERNEGAQQVRNRGSAHTVSFGNSADVQNRKLDIPDKKEGRGEGTPTLSIDGTPLLPAIWRPKINPKFDSSKGLDQNETPYDAPRNPLANFLAKIIGNDASAQNDKFTSEKFAHDQVVRDQISTEQRGEAEKLRTEDRAPDLTGKVTKARGQAEADVEKANKDWRNADRIFTGSQLAEIQAKIKQNSDAIEGKARLRDKAIAEGGFDPNDPEVDKKLHEFYPKSQTYLEAKRQQELAEQQARTDRLAAETDIQRKNQSQREKQDAEILYKDVGGGLIQHKGTGVIYRQEQKINPETGDITHELVPVHGAPKVNLASSSMQKTYEQLKSELVTPDVKAQENNPMDMDRQPSSVEGMSQVQGLKTSPFPAPAASTNAPAPQTPVVQPQVTPAQSAQTVPQYRGDQGTLVQDLMNKLDGLFKPSPDETPEQQAARIQQLQQLQQFQQPQTGWNGL